MAFSAIYAAGDVIALQTGLSFARFMDPSMMAQVSVIESFKNLLAIIVFFTVDAHHLLIRALSKSFDEIPLGVFFIKPPLFGFLVEIAGRIFALGLKIGAPVIFVLMLVEIILGLLARMVPQMNIFIEGLPLKILVSFVILSLSLSFAVPYIGSIFLGVERDVLRLMRLLS
jgi:flagellar biosynthetic protein FliR